MGIHPVKVLIAGGGISGLSTAYFARKMFREQGIAAEIYLVEKSGAMGGKIQTAFRGGCVIERGPDSVLSRKPSFLELTRELGLEGELVTTNPNAKKTYILHKGRLHPLPGGLVMGIPTEVFPFIKTGLISPWGKARAALDLILPRREGEGDESLGDFLARRLGKEVVDHIAEPLLSGIYAGDIRQLSLQASFPQFQELERKYRSLIRGMIASKKEVPSASRLPATAKKGNFLTFRTGLKTLVDRLLEQLDGVRLVNGRAVERVVRTGTRYAVTLDNGENAEVDRVVLALPPYIAADLLPQADSVQKLKQIRYVTIANVVLAFRRADVPFPLDATGFLIPRREDRFITACTWTSAKWLHTAPEDKALFRCYVGRSGEEQYVDLPDYLLVENVLRDLKEIMGLAAEPLFCEISRFYKAMPQYPVGHKELIREVRGELERKMPGVFLTGNGYEGVGVPDCIRQGKETALRLVQSFAEPGAKESNRIINW